MMMSVENDDSSSSGSEDDGFFDAVESLADVRDESTNEVITKKTGVVNNNSNDDIDEPGSAIRQLSHRSSGSASMRALIEEASQPDYKTHVCSTNTVDPVRAPSKSPKVVSEKSVTKLESMLDSNLEKVRGAKSFIISSKEEFLSRRNSNKSAERDTRLSDGSNESETVAAASSEHTPPRKIGLGKISRRRQLPSKVEAAKARNEIPVTNQKQKNGEQSMFLLYTALHAHQGPIWCMKFSSNNKYLATAGEDQRILIWEVLSESSTEGGYSQSDHDELLRQGPNDDDTPPLGLEIQLLSREPVMVFEEHCADIIDFSWSASNFLLSASLDKTVRLWHVTRPSSMHIFHHADLVTSVDFHPQEDSLFLSGGFDRKLRIWSIPDGRVVDWAQTPDIVTAAKFTPSGMFVVAGLINGLVYLYSTEGMRYYTQISCRNRHGKNREGRKVTGLSFVVNHDIPTNNPEQKINALRLSEQLLVTTNDSRIRLFGLDDYCMISKYKGLVNTSMQIKAHFSDSGSSIICGSEVGNICMWNTSTNQPNTTNIPSPQFNKGNLTYNRNNVFSYFQACDASDTNTTPIVTEALFAPTISAKNAVLGSNLFPTIKNIHNVNYDFSTAMIVSSDYDGTIRVFVRKSCFDAMIFASGPEGFEED